MEEGEGAGKKKAWEQRHTAAAKVVASTTLVVFIVVLAVVERECGRISKCVNWCRSGFAMCFLLGGSGGSIF